MREENDHFATDATRDRADVIVDGAPSEDIDLERDFVRLR
jgi:hypothetical protein